MALLDWGFGSDNQDNQDNQDNLFQTSPIKQIGSVQSSWQPNQSSTPGQNGQPAQNSQNSNDPLQNNYLFSQQKEQVDQQRQQRQAAEEAARAQAAAEAEQARQAQAAAQAAAAASQPTQTTQVKYTPKYAGNSQQKDEGLWGFLKGIGAVVQQSVGAFGDIAVEGGGAIDYAGQRLRGISDAQASQNVARNYGSLRDMLHGVKDITGRNIVGTQDVDQHAANIAAGRGNLQDYTAVGGKALQAGIDSTMFINPARLATAGVLPTVERASTMLGRVATNPAVQYAARDAAFYGGLQGTATTAQEYGQTGDINKALEVGAGDAVVGGLLQGTLDAAGHLTQKGYKTLIPIANKTLGSLRKPSEVRIGDEIVQLGDNSEVPHTTPEEQAAKANDTPVTPATSQAQDSNLSFQSHIDNTPPEPIANTFLSGDPVPAQNNITSPPPPTPDPNVPTDMPKPADGVAQTPPPSPVDQVNLQNVTPVKDAPAPAGGVAPVADGTVKPSEILPVTDGKMPMVKSEQVKALQDAKAGASQADEAAINQKLQQEQFNVTPKYTDSKVIHMSPDDYIKEAFKHQPNYNPEAHPDAIERATRYADAMKNGDKFDMPILGKDSQDGFHRVFAAKINGRNEIPVEIKKDSDLYNQAHSEVKTVPKETSENLPDGMSTDATTVSADGAPLTREQIAQRFAPKLADNTDMKQHIADAAGMGKDTASPIRDILHQGGVKPAHAERIATQFDTLEKQLQDYNRLQEENQKAYAKGGDTAINEEAIKARNRVTRDMGVTTRQLVNEVKRIEGSKDLKARVANNITELIGTRNANVLTSAGLIERNMLQEATANAKLAIKNPIKMAKSTLTHGNILADSAKAELSHWKDTPHNPLDALHYVVGNVYRTAMIPTTALANTRRGAVREELTKWAFKELEGRNLTSPEAKKLSGIAGNEMEALVNTFIGADNGMTNRGQATEALKAWKEYMRTGDDGAKATYMSRIEAHSSLADKMVAGASKDDATKFKVMKAMGNLIFPFMRTAGNLMKTTVQQDLNPMAKSLLDEIRADQRSGGANAVNLIKSKLVDYGIMGGAAALAGSGVLAYNNGDQIDKPKGWSLKIGDNNYVPVRATSLELPLALAGTAEQITQDIINHKTRDWSYYAGMVTGSLPYIDQINQATGVVDSLMNAGSDSASGGDGGYAAKSYAINMGKSFVPFSNNSVQPYVAGKEGQSLNAKSVYDKNMATWMYNTVRKSYDPNFYNSLKDNRDNAGRVRTVDNQGIVSNKTINDANTAKYNTTVDKLVTYNRENGLGKGTQDMFNSFDTGKNNNFKSVQDTIAFLDVPKGQNPDNAKKLESNGKLANLSKQIHDGFYGTTGNDLLTLDGQNLKSDVSVPNKDGSKNSRLPLSMQSIKNAVAQTDLAQGDSDKLYKLSQGKTALYNQLKAKSITYDQYTASKVKLEKTEVSILSASKNYQKLVGFMDNLKKNNFFSADGMGSTKSGQTYLWNSLNALLGSKGATPGANYPDATKKFTPWGYGHGGRRGGAPNTLKPGSNTGTDGVKWSPVSARKLASVAQGRYTPVNFKVKLGNGVKKDKTQNYSDRTI